MIVLGDGAPWVEVSYQRLEPTNLTHTPLMVATFIATVAQVGSALAGERFACNVKGLTQAEHQRHSELTQVLLKSVLEKRELPNGYGFRLERSLLATTAE